jgi:hypothetical protein
MVGLPNLMGFLPNVFLTVIFILFFCFFNNEKFINVDKTKTPFTKLGCLDTTKNSVETWKDTTTKGKLL